MAPKTTPRKRATRVAQRQSAQRWAKRTPDHAAEARYQHGRAWYLGLVSVSEAIVRTVEQELRDRVADARAAGCTWQDIGDQLGVSRQAVTKRFGP